MPAKPDPSLLRGDYVRVVREALGLTRGELADLLDVSFDTLRSWEANRRGTPPGVITQLQEIQDRHAREITQALMDYPALRDEDGNLPVLTITSGDASRPPGWQRRIAASIAHACSDLIVDDQARREAGGSQD
ncbi:helix-turn-helix transcriptional regulator (plasmid) [Micrococcaceae bacterium Sec6.3]